LSSTSSPRTSLSLCCLRLLLIYPIYPGMRSTHHASPKTYSSSHESTITMASRRATPLTLRAVSPAACTEGSCRDAVVGFAVCGHYVSYYPLLSDLILYSHPCVPVDVLYCYHVGHHVLHPASQICLSMLDFSYSSVVYFGQVSSRVCVISIS